MAKSEKIYCPLLERYIEWGYCWELRNIGTNEILIESDVVEDWDKALDICKKCGLYDS